MLHPASLELLEDLGSERTAVSGDVMQAGKQSNSSISSRLATHRLNSSFHFLFLHFKFEKLFHYGLTMTI